MLFADQLGVKVKFETPNTFDDILNRIAKGKADIAAAGLTITEQRNKKMRFAPAYHEITEQLIYRSGTRRPNNISSLTHGIIEVAKGTSHIDSLTYLKLDTPALAWSVKDRTDPNQSIAGGARYFQQRIQIIPEQIPEPDRTWFALASYNVGLGHLEDARVLTKKQGGNPDKWMDVKQRLPLLTQKKWHQQTKHGYARGQEPVEFVENIRSYYDLLVWLTEENKIKKNAMDDAESEDTEHEAVTIDPAAL